METIVKKGYVLRIGIDDFKDIRAYKGIEYSDMILHKTEECIQAAITEKQKIYRISDDEFIVTGFNSPEEDGKKLYDRICDQTMKFMEEKDYEVFLKISAGFVNLGDVEDHSHNNLMQITEFALSEAVKSGKNMFYVYTDEDYTAFSHKEELLHIMQRAIHHDFEGFETYFQPIVKMEDGELLSAETLLRFCSEETGQVSPAEFIPLLEESELIIPVGRWVLYQAVKACSEIQKTIHDFQISVNISYIQILKSDLLKDLAKAMEIYSLPKGSMILELTESGFLEMNPDFTGFCNGLKELGISFALDDFGTGYSNFHYLYSLSPNTIKIDRSFTVKALKGEWEYKLLHHMAEMTHSMNLKLCVEGIETKEELERINGIGPDYIQGFYFGRPSPFGTFLEEYVKYNIKVKAV